MLETVDRTAYLNSQSQDISGVKQINGHPTAIYNAFLKHDGDLLAAVADMRIHEEIDSDEVKLGCPSAYPACRVYSSYIR